MWHYFEYRSGWLHTHTSVRTCTAKKTYFLKHKLNYTFKAEQNQNAQKLICFPFSDRGSWLLLNDITLRRVAGLKGYFKSPVFRGGKKTAVLSKVSRWRGGNFSLTARQSMVKVDVAQVFWRPFWQTHFVVVVDHPPAGEEDSVGNAFNVSLVSELTVMRGNGSIYSFYSVWIKYS